MTATYPPPGLPADVGGADEDDQLPPPPAPPDGRVRRAWRRLPPWVGPVAVGGLGIAACTYVALVDPSTQASAVYPRCTFKEITGLDCPGCGLTRAMHALLTGHPLTALDHNIFVLLIVPIALYMYVKWFSRSLFGYELPSIPSKRWMPYTLAPALAAFWILRNIPWGPLPWLAATAG
jgi:hypothetical protein